MAAKDIIVFPARLAKESVTKPRKVLRTARDYWKKKLKGEASPTTTMEQRKKNPVNYKGATDTVRSRRRRLEEVY